MKFCSNCGSPIEDNATFCGNCGSQITMGEAENSNAQQPEQQAYQQPNQQAYQQPNQQAYQQPNQQAYQQAYQQPYQQPNQYTYQQPYQQPYANQNKPAGNSTKIIIGVVAAVAVIALIVVLCITVFSKKSSGGGTGYKAVISDLMDAMSEGDADKAGDLFLESVRDDYMSEMEYTFSEIDVYLEDYGLSYSVKHKINDAEELDDDDLESLNKNLSEYGDIEVTEAYDVDITMTINISGSYEGEDVDENQKQDANIVVGKYDGKWYLVDLDGEIGY